MFSTFEGRLMDVGISVVGASESASLPWIRAQSNGFNLFWHNIQLHPMNTSHPDLIRHNGFPLSLSQILQIPHIGSWAEKAQGP